MTSIVELRLFTLLLTSFVSSTCSLLLPLQSQTKSPVLKVFVFVVTSGNNALTHHQMLTPRLPALEKVSIHSTDCFPRTSKLPSRSYEVIYASGTLLPQLPKPRQMPSALSSRFRAFTFANSPASIPPSVMSISAFNWLEWSVIPLALLHRD
jgi:hypothetical protein